jgi:taurine transport system ATP-binding protein
MEAASALAFPHLDDQSGFTEHTAAAAISVRDVSLSFKQGKAYRKVLSDISLDIAEGEFVVVLGASGSGKTSLLRMLAGYERPSTGSLVVLGDASPRPNQSVGVVFQHANLFPWLSVQRNTEFGLKMKKLAKLERERIAAATLAGVGLGDYRSYMPHQLSGGMKQRAAIARTLASEPKIILMDEPFGALDAITREHLQSLVKTLWKQNKQTIFFITHDVDEALYLGSRIMVINGSPGTIGVDMANPIPGGTDSIAALRQHPEYASERLRLMQALDGY